MSERDLEEEYFAKQDREKLAAMREQMDAEKAATEKAERAKLHHHKCGKCGDDMETQAFRGVEIEICPSCGAVLLDPGELQQLAGDDEGGFVSGLINIFKK